MAVISPPAEIIQWSRPSRQLSGGESDAFFNAPLSRLTLFSFTTADLTVAAHAGPLSLKTVFRGKERYAIGRRQVALQPGQVLIVNEGERYGSAIDDETESFSLFIPQSEAAAALGAAAGARELIEEGGAAPSDGFIQAPFIATAALAATLHSIRACLRSGDAALVSAGLRHLLVDAFRACLGLAPPRALRHLQRATRDEIIGRLVRAHAHIVAQEGADCALPALASIACMSPYHFVRRFGELYGQTPAAFSRRVRLRTAKAAITRGMDITVAARRAGYCSLEAFARALRRL